MIIPSIDIMDGKAVQLVQGRQKVLERTDVEELAREFNLYGEIAVIDLDAALGRGENEGLIRRLGQIADIRVGGGIRSETKARRILRGGAKKVIIGTMATPSFMERFNPEHVIAAVDSRGGKVTTHGWTRETSTSTLEKMEELEPYCGEFLYTDVEREGMEQGVDIRAVTELRGRTSNQFTYAGGITNSDEILALENIGANSQIGMSLYRGKLSLAKTLVRLLDFNMVPLKEREDSPPLIPTIVQDTQGKILMQAYSSKESLERALLERRGIYHSRSRRGIWRKGDTSGSTQELLKVRYDCDRDSVVFTVKQIDGACHRGSYSCFQDNFSIEDLHRTIKERIRKGSPKSYTARVADTEETVMEKILEEALEVVNYTDRENLIWEIADLSYFLLILMARQGVDPGDIINELRSRRR